MQVEGHEIIIGGATLQDSATVLGLELDPAMHLNTTLFTPIWAPWPGDQIEEPQVAPVEDYTPQYGHGTVRGLFSH